MRSISYLAEVASAVVKKYIVVGDSALKRIMHASIATPYNQPVTGFI